MRAALRLNRAALRHRAADAPVWLFDLDDTLHDASAWAVDGISVEMNAYIARELGVSAADADALRRRYWLRYGATLLGLERHHGVGRHHFAAHTHHLPQLETSVRGHGPDLTALWRLRGRAVILTNAPRRYAERVLAVLGIRDRFEAVVGIDDMALFGQLRPKPDARMLRRLAVALGVDLSRCVLVEDALSHAKAARRVGMGSVWMQRWLGAPSAHQPYRYRAMARRPAYVDARIGRLDALVRRPR
ncbi:MAG: HAD-IA family hydrolase [Aquabacterium sp.]